MPNSVENLTLPPPHDVDLPRAKPRATLYSRKLPLFKGEDIEVSMPIDPTVIAVLLSAIDKDPENAALRLHLASLLFDSGQMDEALKHCAVILASQPDHIEALDYAARAAEALGDAKRAEGYRRLLRALSAENPAAPPLPPQKN